MPTQTLEDFRPSIEYAFLHFYHLDHANAAVHTSPVRYSPITFRLARACSQKPGDSEIREAVDDVLIDEGSYPEDRGRIEADPS